MMKFAPLVRYFFISVTLICGPKWVTSHSSFPSLLIISMDAFRHDYVDECLTPTIFSMRSKGVYAPNLQSVFPTKTFPNHHTIATGVYPEVHGVLDNSVYIAKDPCGNKSVVGSSYELFHANNEVIPLWTLNQLAGHGRHSGIMMWPGGDFPYGDRRTLPTFWVRAAFNISFEKRVDEVIHWFTHPLHPANLVFMYFEEPDLHGHAYGVESKQIRDQLKRLDNTLKYLLKRLAEKSLESVVNTFLLGDHGMVSIIEDRIIDLDKYLDKNLYVAASTSPTIQIFPKVGAESEVLAGLKAALAAWPGTFDFYKREEIPQRWHYAASTRAPPILAVAREGYAFSDVRPSIHDLNKRFHIPPSPSNLYGLHGYDNRLSSMKPMFSAWGPAIRASGRIDPFELVRLFPTWAQILGLPLANQAGPFAAPLSRLLRTPSASAALIAPPIHFDAPIPIAFVVGYLTWTVVIVMSVAASTVFFLYLRHYRSSPNGGGIATNISQADPRIQHDIEAQHLLTRMRSHQFRMRRKLMIDFKQNCKQCGRRFEGETSELYGCEHNFK